MERDEARRRFAGSPVARLGTITPDGRPHLVAVTFAVLEGRADAPAAPAEPDTIAFAVDAKPKSTRGLQRLTNLRAHPAASLLVDHYDDDWTKLWWVRADGEASIIELDRDRSRDDLPGHPSAADAENALAALAAKYPAYAQDPPAGPVVLITVDRWRGWHA
jgi:PPOX class probable F420-dependent enzyme